MKNFREFKENIVSSIQKKIAERLEAKKIEMARKMFSEGIDEGMEAFKAAAEVLKVFGGKKPSKASDLMKFDSELEKASKKYDVSVDDILKVINK